MNQSNGRVNAFRITFLATLVLLIIEYVLGMIANLEVQFPDSLPGGNAWAWVFENSLVIQLHIYVGTLLVLVALAAVILSLVARHVAGIVAAVAGLVLIILAWLAGAQFLATQQNGISLTMALAFIGACAAYVLGYAFSGVSPISAVGNSPHLDGPG
jgi:hypothetical protein